LTSTNVIESAFTIVETVCRNVKPWREGDQIERWVASGLLVAERQFRKVIGHRQIPMLLSSRHDEEPIIQDMDISGWNDRYRSGERPLEDLEAAPTPLLIETARQIAPGKALDLACGTGRNALWLAEHDWSVTAIDGAPAAIEILRHRASERRLVLDGRVADLQKGEYVIEPSNWDLVAICYYSQRDLFEPARQGVIPGGLIVAIVHITEPGEEPTHRRLRSGDLGDYFRDWEILHSYEGKPIDRAHRHAVAEIVARRPAGSPRDSTLDPRR
jgi:SAM-dependent methyltransferase